LALAGQGPELIFEILFILLIPLSCLSLVSSVCSVVTGPPSTLRDLGLDGGFLLAFFFISEPILRNRASSIIHRLNP
jgi:hypothetical protein